MVHNWFIVLDNLVEIVVHYLLIGGMTYLGYQNDFPMVSALMCMVTHWTGPMMNRDINYWVVMIHYATILCELSTSRGYWVYTKINRRLWLMGVTIRWSLISYEFSHYGWRLMIIDILNRGTLISYEVKISCPLKWS